MKNKNKIRGCLIGGAVGDALGYPVEFCEDRTIFELYGESGITEYALSDGIAQVSDDTQMTLFTANGLLIGKTRGMMRGTMGPYQSYIALCYKDWLKTQGAEYTGYSEGDYSWLNNIPEMNHSRAPGHTCINYITDENFGSTETPTNNSKGCGGIMRVAPIALYFDNDMIADEIDMIGAEAAALTHGHELGYIPAAMLVHIIHFLANKSEASVLEAVTDAKETMHRLFPSAEYMPVLDSLIDKAITLAVLDIDDLDAIRQLGEGWVAEETLAIAVFCALKYEDDFEKAVIASVNHSGDSDSTGSVTGNIMGARLGIDSIPQKFLDNLELRDTILEIADDLFEDCKMSEYDEFYDEIWASKYIYHSYPVIEKLR